MSLYFYIVGIERCLDQGRVSVHSAGTTRKGSCFLVPGYGWRWGVCRERLHCFPLSLGTFTSSSMFFFCTCTIRPVREHADK